MISRIKQMKDGQVTDHDTEAERETKEDTSRQPNDVVASNVDVCHERLPPGSNSNTFRNQNPQKP